MNDALRPRHHPREGVTGRAGERTVERATEWRSDVAPASGEILERESR